LTSFQFSSLDRYAAAAATPTVPTSFFILPMYDPPIENYEKLSVEGNFILIANDTQYLKF
jgi:hypothetical protein